MAESQSYVVGGTVQAGDGIYLARAADEELLALCRQSIFAYVLTPRQMGKSSLMVRTAERLAAEKIQSVIIDLQQFGTQVSAEEWYLGLLTTIEDELDLDTDVIAWWQERSELGVTQRLTQFFRDVLLDEIEEPIVIFIDEIDTTLSLEFTDDLYAAIRYLYLARARQPEFGRLSFVLVGVATPSDLIRDPKRTPFNIGQRVNLTDFTAEEALPLATGLGSGETDGAQVLDWVLDWTGGHPYLTQRLCQALVSAEVQDWSAAAVEQVVQRTFLGRESQKDSNLQFVRDMLTKRSPDLAEGLTIYREVWRGRQPVEDEEQSLAKSHLKLSGVVRRWDGGLQVRNPIYRQVFDQAWVREHLPINWKKRLQRTAAGLVATLLFASLPLAVWANWERMRADDLRQQAENSAAAATKQASLARRNATEAQQQADLAGQSEQRAKRSEQEAKKQAKLAEKRRQLADRARQQALTAQRAEAQQRQLAETRRQEAEAARLEETRQRQIAETRRQEAEGARREEARQKQIAEQKRQEAEVARQEADQQRAKAEKSELEAQRQTVIARSNYSQSQFLSHRQLEALLTAVRAGRQVQAQPEVRRTDATIHAAAALQQAFYGAREQNRLQGHSGSVWGVSFSPDGNTLASASDDRTVKVWTREGELLHTLEGHSGIVRGVSFSPDGNTLASASDDSTVKVWSPQKQLIAAFPKPNQQQKGHRGWVYSVHFNPILKTSSKTGGGNTVVSASNDNTVKLWNHNSSPPRTFGIPGHSGWVWGMSFSPDGNTIASASEDSTVKVWTREGELLHTLEGHSDSVLGVSFSPDGNTIASASEDRTVKVWTREGELLHTLEGHSGIVWGVSFSPDGNTIASASSDRTVKVWTREGELLHTLEGHSGWVWGVSFSPTMATPLPLPVRTAPSKCGRARESYCTPSKAIAVGLGA